MRSCSDVRPDKLQAQDGDSLRAEILYSVQQVSSFAYSFINILTLQKLTNKDLHFLSIVIANLH